MSKKLKVGDKVITYDGKYQGKIRETGTHGHTSIIFDNEEDSWSYTNFLFDCWEDWEDDLPISYKRVVLLSEYEAQEEKEEVIELFLDDEDEEYEG